MAFDKLADGIINHNKAIIALWVVVLIIATPFAVKAFDVLVYDTTEMANDDSDSVLGLTILGEEFPKGGADMTTTPIMVITYDGEEGLIAAQALIQELNKNATSYVTEDGTYKLNLQNDMAFMVSSIPESDADILMGAVSYNTDLTKDSTTFISDDTPFLRDYIAEYAGDLDGVTVYITGTPAITYDTMAGAMEDISKIDPFTILLILILVGLFFRSFITSTTPPLVIGVAFVIAMALFFFIGQVLDIFFITQIILLVAMMGAGCDYCIFIIARYREELRAGREHKAALHEAIKWAGESIAISGASVIIGFGAMAICSIDMISAMGICLALGILIALLAALTLIPAILARIGDRIFWPTRLESFKEGGKATRGWFAWFGKRGHSYFVKSAKFSQKHAVAITVMAILVTLPAAHVALTSETSYNMIGAMQSGDSGEGMDILSEYVDQGMIMPNYALIEYDTPVANVEMRDGMPMLYWTPQWTEVGGIREQLNDLAADMKEKDGGSDGNIGSVIVPYEWDSEVEEVGGLDPTIDPGMALMRIVEDAPSITISGVLSAAIPKIVDGFKSAIEEQIPGIPEDQALAQAQLMLLSTGGPIMDYVVNSQCMMLGGSYADEGATSGDATFVSITMSTHAEAMDPRSMESIDAMAKALDEYKTEQGSRVVATWVTGTAAVMYDVSKQVGEEFTTIEIIVVLAILIMLFVVMRSYTIPFRSIFTILMSICWTLAITHVVFVDILGGEVIWMIPMILLVICLGLGMDYDILLTTRIKENVRDKGMSNDDAIHSAVVSTGSIITICGLIMGGAFGTMMLSSMEMLQEFGFALCFAILIDALVVRTYIVPAVMHLLGDWNWRGPGHRIPKKDSEHSE